MADGKLIEFAPQPEDGAPKITRSKSIRSACDHQAQLIIDDRRENRNHVGRARSGEGARPRPHGGRTVKIIFLDIDGVLNDRSCYFKGNRDRWGVKPNPVCTSELNRILATTDARIVVTSAWRIGRTVESLQEMLTDWGVTGIVIDATPRFPDREPEGATSTWVSTPRGAEIQSWLINFGESKVDAFVILDDDSDMVHLADRLVQTSFDSGLTASHADRAITMLSEVPA